MARYPTQALSLVLLALNIVVRESPCYAQKSAISSTSSNFPQATYTVKVGSKESPHGYSPAIVYANIGDVIIFEFYPRNHSVVQADFLAPCAPSSKTRYFYSGTFNSFNEYDGVLVGENKTMSWAAQQSKAKEYPYMLVPGQAPPAESDGSPVPTSSSSTTSTTTSTSTSTSTSHPPPPSPELSDGAIAGIVVGCVAVVALIGALLFILGRNRVYRRWLESEDSTSERTRRWTLGAGDGLFSHPSKPPDPRHMSWDGQGMYSQGPDGERQPEMGMARDPRMAELTGSPPPIP
ncbi:extracellular serine-rich protein [Arthroderma uncinatum]|uniref:extracellular serine-rich protein n=1 Tax=Arthroderma uncinatum TaxID=74035 RepID=UPI00144A8959|nr:extracellular serine-rich protein [Arthroderma uncinatum]KAF3480201.1 extracellular serine-rich protein [Arthroderma uncinatum]